MNNAHNDLIKDNIETAKRWLKCEENCPSELYTECDGNPFNCGNIAGCLFDKCEELLLRMRDMK